MAFGTSFNNALTLPIQKAIDGAMSSVTGALKQVGQQTSNSDVPTDALKKAEAIMRLQGGREYGPFSSVSRDMNLETRNGMKVATNAGTGKAIAPVGPVQTGSTPANLAGGGAGEDNTTELKVMLSSEPKISGWLQDITFAAMPTIAESHSVTYESFTPLHHPGEILKYQRTNARQWTVTARLISRNIPEASNNLAIINTLRGWMMPFYGEGTASNSETQQYLGAPPAIVTLKAYGHSMIGPVKCIIESANWDWPNDVDYVQAETYDEQQVPFPAIMQVSISLKESWSPAEYSGFSLAEYRKGNLPQAFAAISAGSAASGAQAGQRSTPNAGTDPAAVSRAEPANAGGAKARAGEPGADRPNRGGR